MQPQNNKLNVLASAVSVLQNATGLSVLPLNEDRLAKEGKKLDQEVAYKEAKIIVYHKEKKRWLKQHPSYNSEDNFYQLSRDQVIMVRLRTGYCRLRHHLRTKLHIGDTDMCPCGMAPMTVQHLLQDFTTHQNERKATWPTETPVKEKIFGLLEDMRRTVTFVQRTGFFYVISVYVLIKSKCLM